MAKAAGDFSNTYSWNVKNYNFNAINIFIITDLIFLKLVGLVKVLHVNSKKKKRLNW